MISQRPITLAAATTVGLLSGTGYAFSSWAPQLSDRCHLSALSINLIGIAGNLGVYVMSPFAGKLVDRFGLRLPLMGGALCLFLGYFGLQYAYRVEWNHGGIVLYFFCFITGIGSALGNLAALNAAAKSYPLNRGSATALPIASYGLSAFVFSRIAHFFFVGHTERYLLTLAITCGVGLFLCSLCIKLPSSNLQENRRTRRKSFSTRDDEPESGMLLADGTDDEAEDEIEAPTVIDSVILPDTEAEVFAEVTGWALFKHLDFCLMITIIGLLSGCGLMWINNIGNNLVALYRAEVNSLAEMDPVVLERLQAANVSVLSLFNCAGRIFGGVVSDVAKTRIRLQRSAFLLGSAVIFVLVSVSAYHNTSSSNLIYYTSALASAYGTMFGVGPVLTLEKYGVKDFSFNWGLVSVAPGLSGNLFNLLYGRIYDLHSDPVTHKCDVGVRCYRDAFVFTAVGCSVAVLCALTLFVRHTREARLLAKRSGT
ncbi:major facilitator superfamily domain-containing protein [Protomyces lactucae-debilis]|uniref:Major facilitator superfamily domain-containing protein n=1 Tax=Protomyces lactucae-debilis TaxID=2754530 RepID=A0A1Y2FS18_PROLT|nr:major facilitator superfamily domain-containing protein [Protomyces lactucae-debilis]ORY86094.1 major facilitator superfamily domain-containing protein [Protomyces lactucae-debilis]